MPRTMEQADPRRGQLDDAHLVAYACVVVEVEADLVSIEGHRPVNVCDRNDHHFELPFHGP